MVLIVIGGIAGTILASKSFEVRRSWAKELEDLKVKNEANEVSLKNKKEENQELSSEYERVRVGYGIYWTDVETQVESQVDGLVRVNQLGTNQGIVINEDGTPTILYGFQPAGEGKYLYVGAFVVDQIGDDQAVLKATWRVRPSESGLWEDGAWRWRSLLPESDVSKINHYHNELVIADEFLVAQNKNKEVQEKLLQDAQRQLEKRRDELISDQKETEGLILALEKQSNERDQSLKVLDETRIELKKAVDLRASLIQQIKQLKDQLPGASQSSTTPKLSQKNDLK